MAAEFDGWAIARQRIAKEARERTGKLDLTGLGLEKIASQVVGLTHLPELAWGTPVWQWFADKGNSTVLRRPATFFGSRSRSQ